MTPTFAELAARYKALAQTMPDDETEGQRVGDLGTRIGSTPLLTRDDAVAALDLVIDPNTNIDLSTSTLVLERLRSYIQDRLPPGLSVCP